MSELHALLVALDALDQAMTKGPPVAKYKGFGDHPPEERKRLAAIGGRAAHKAGKAWEWNKEEAAEAGRKGGLESWRRKRAKRALEGK